MAGLDLNKKLLAYPAARDGEGAFARALLSILMSR